MNYCLACYFVVLNSFQLDSGELPLEQFYWKPGKGGGMPFESFWLVNLKWGGASCDDFDIKANEVMIILENRSGVAAVSYLHLPLMAFKSWHLVGDGIDFEENYLLDARPPVNSSIR